MVAEYLQDTQDWNPNDPVPMEVDATKARGKGKEGKDTAEGEEKSTSKRKSNDKNKDKGQTPKGRGQTSGDHRTCYSCGRRGHSAQRLQNVRRHWDSNAASAWFAPWRNSSIFVATSKYVCSVTFHSDSSVRGVNDASC